MKAKMSTVDLKIKLESHLKWLHHEGDGKRANLSFANLNSADLRSANLSFADLRFANLHSANLHFADLSSADLSFANLRSANLSSADLDSANLHFADLHFADLSFANLDFSSWPLWCGSKDVKVDLKIVYQLCAHLSVLDCDTPEYNKIKKFLLPFARKSHRAKELDIPEKATLGS